MRSLPKQLLKLDLKVPYAQHGGIVSNTIRSWLEGEDEAGNKVDLNIIHIAMGRKWGDLEGVFATSIGQENEIKLVKVFEKRGIEFETVLG